jgi:hypothetical protein
MQRIAKEEEGEEEGDHLGASIHFSACEGDEKFI